MHRHGELRLALGVQRTHPAGVDPQRALTLMEQPEKFPGIGVAPEPARTYPAPAGANAAHLLGWVARAGADDVESGGGAMDDEDVVGRSGLEAHYDTELRGRNGATVVAIDPRGVVTETLSSRNPVPGSDVVTHLDARLQARAEAVLAQTVASARADGDRRLRADSRPGSGSAGESNSNVHPMATAG